MEFELTEQERQIKDMAHQFAKFVLRPMSLEADRLHRMPDDFLMRIAAMRIMPGEGLDAGGITEELEGAGAAKDPKKKKSTGRLAMVGAEELAWGDASILLCLPGPGLGGPPVRFKWYKPPEPDKSWTAHCSIPFDSVPARERKIFGLPS